MHTFHEFKNFSVFLEKKKHYICMTFDCILWALVVCGYLTLEILSVSCFVQIIMSLTILCENYRMKMSVSTHWLTSLQSRASLSRTCCLSQSLMTGYAQIYIHFSSFEIPELSLTWPHWPLISQRITWSVLFLILLMVLMEKNHAQPLVTMRSSRGSLIQASIGMQMWLAAWPVHYNRNNNSLGQTVQLLH